MARITGEDAHAGDIAQSFIHIIGHGFPLPDLFGEAVQGHVAQGRLQLGHAIVRTDGKDFGRRAMGATAVDDTGSAISQLLGSAEQNPTFPGSQNL